MTLRLRHSRRINLYQNGLNLDVEPMPTIMTGGGKRIKRLLDRR